MTEKEREFFNVRRRAILGSCNRIRVIIVELKDIIGKDNLRLLVNSIGVIEDALIKYNDVLQREKDAEQNKDAEQVAEGDTEDELESEEDQNNRGDSE
jgi:hypothetical protein